MSCFSWLLSLWSHLSSFWKSPLSSESHLFIKTNSCFGLFENPPMKIPRTLQLDYSFSRMNSISYTFHHVFVLQRTEPMPTNYYLPLYYPTSLFSLCIKNILHTVHGK